MPDLRAMFGLVVFLAAAAPARALEGPALRSLASASSVPTLDATLERQSEESGAPFTGAPGAAPVRTDAAKEKFSAPRLEPSGAPSRGASAGAPAGRERTREIPPPLSDAERGRLKTVRAAGAVAAAAGLGLLAYAVAAGAAGPVGWAAALLFFGGLSAYLAHRRLAGHNDFA